MRFNHRYHQSLIDNAGSPAYMNQGKVTIYPIGAVVTSNVNTSSIPVDNVHSAVVGDKILIVKPNTQEYSGADTVQSVASNLITMGNAYNVSSGNKIVVLGPDTSTGATPNYNASPMKIYRDADGHDTINNATITCNSFGEYDYYTYADGKYWEVLRDSGDAYVRTICGWGGSAGRYNVHDFGAVGDGTTDDEPRLSALARSSSEQRAGVYFPATKDFYLTQAPIWWGTIAADLMRGTQHIYGDGVATIIEGKFSNGAIFEMEGKHYCTVQRIHLRGNTITPPQAGLFVGKANNDTDQAANEHLYQKLIISGNFTESCVVNYGTENTHWDMCRFEVTDGSTAERVYFASRKQDLNITTVASAQVPSGLTSCQLNLFTRCSFDMKRTDVGTVSLSCVQLDSIRGFHFNGCMFNREDQARQRDIVLHAQHQQMENVSVEHCLFHDQNAFTNGMDNLVFESNDAANQFFFMISFRNNRQTASDGTLRVKDKTRVRESYLESRDLILDAGGNIQQNSRAVVLNNYQQNTNSQFEGFLSIEHTAVASIAQEQRFRGIMFKSGDNATASAGSFRLYTCSLGLPEEPTTSSLVNNAITPAPNAGTVRLVPQAKNFDYLDRIEGGYDGQLLILRSAFNSNQIIVRDRKGNLSLTADFGLNHRHDMLMLQYNASLDFWVEIARANNDMPFQNWPLPFFP